MMTIENICELTADLPDREGIRRFYEKLSNDSPFEAKKLAKNKGLLSDILTISGYSPLLSLTILQNPEYIGWLKRQRISSTIRTKEELLESLARFAMTNSQIEPSIMLSRFRRRELIRIYLKDIRGLGTIAEITEELSNLADAILEYALNLSRQELDNRYGVPLEFDDKNKATRAKFCIVALGKLGSKELNYSSDIDLVFIYSNDGKTSGQGDKGETTNRQYFVKLSEFVSKLVGKQIGEGAAYRVDLRLRPHGRVGALAISVREAAKYYRNSARMWEKQVLIRSRASAGDGKVFRDFFRLVETDVFSEELKVEEALNNVRLSKEQINLEKIRQNGFDVKLGTGGIREIEFIAQALQLAYGGKDEWLRSPHTLISLSRLADRNLLTETELTQLFEAYDFLRRLEHRLQMEHGLQTHLVPDDIEKKLIISQRMGIHFVADFNVELEKHTNSVNRIFTNIFGEDFAEYSRKNKKNANIKIEKKVVESGNIDTFLSSFAKSELEEKLDEKKISILKKFSEISPPFSEMLTANPKFIEDLPNVSDAFSDKNYFETIHQKIENCQSFADCLAALRTTWASFILKIAFFDIFQTTDLPTIRDLQTKLAEACIENSVNTAKNELEKYYDINISDFPFAVLGVGKLGSGGMDYDSDLDLILVYDDDKPLTVNDLTHKEFYSKAVEIFVTTLSSLTRDGSLYRVDLRLRPDGKNGSTAIGKNAFFNYLETRSAIWEWLAYVKIRGVAGNAELAKYAEEEARRIIHNNALNVAREELRTETKRIREKLEQSKSNSRRGKEIDIKFGEGGLQDIYFAIRFLQLRDNIPDDAENRSTLFSLDKLYKNDSLSKENYAKLADGYKFLSELDHNLRLCVGRSTRVPYANQKALQIIANRMNLQTTAELLEQLTQYRLSINSAYENILQN